MRKLNASRVESEDGLLQIYVNTRRWKIEYQDGSKTTDIVINNMMSELGIAVFENSVQHWNDETRTPISTEERAVILANVEEALRLLDSPYKIV